jgi:ATP-dependent DNA helicase RecG
MADSSSLTELKGVGPELAKKLERLGISSVESLLAHYPRRYDDYSKLTDIARLSPGQVSVRARIKQVSGRYLRRGLHLTEAVASDDSGSVRLIWFNQPYRATAIKPNTDYYISGVFELGRGRLSINNPSMELVSDFPLSTARIVPVYPETKGLKSNQIRRLIRDNLPDSKNWEETLPGWLITEMELLPLGEAVKNMHFPADASTLEAARRRLGFEEVFGLSLASLINRSEVDKQKAIAIPFSEKLAKDFVGHLPFKLTDAQRRVVWQIYQDMAGTSPMNRLIEGDVGSGKTVVATMAALMALEQGFQAVIMAPTELLARQHAETIYKMLKPLEFQDRVGLLVGGLSAKQKTLMHHQVASGKVGLLIGTHAVIEDKVSLDNLGLVVVDEQHRFGVDQRRKLQAKAGHPVHLLSMSATPIPRSLALTLYGEMDISVLDSKPAGRLPIITKITSPNSRAQLYQEIQVELDRGRQMFVVAPLIDDSEIQPDSRSVTKVYKDMQIAFPNKRVGLMHGRLAADDKNSVMESFVNHDLDILVSTTVIEVGVDVPNATIMLIEDADRFGLAQVHQLRGRVGRGQHQGYCYLMPADSGPKSKRLVALASSSDGFALAELDLKLRGPGAIYGQAQHGALDLRVARLDDKQLIMQARAAAERFIKSQESLLNYPRLNTKVQKLRAVTNLN